MVGTGADRRGQQVRAVCSHPRAVVRRGPAPPAPSGQHPRQRALLLLLASQRAWGPGIQTRVPLSPAFGDPFASSLVPPHSQGSAVPASTAVTGEAPLRGIQAHAPPSGAVSGRCPHFRRRSPSRVLVHRLLSFCGSGHPGLSSTPSGTSPSTPLSQLTRGRFEKASIVDFDGRLPHLTCTVWLDV